MKTREVKPNKRAKRKVHVIDLQLVKVGDDDVVDLQND
jgi:hypothetical protein